MAPPPPIMGADPDAVAAYMEVLDRVLEDRMVAAEEAEALCDMATAWELTTEHLATIHLSYMHELVRAAMADGVLTREEHEDLRIFADTLGVERQVVVDEITAALIQEGG